MAMGLQLLTVLAAIALSNTQLLTLYHYRTVIPAEHLSVLIQSGKSYAIESVYPGLHSPQATPVLHV